jgi:signal transduction histidine kinase
LHDVQEHAGFTGIGMAPEMIPIALEPFRQIHEPQSGIAHEGTGLGLPLAKSLTDQHGGKMIIESELRKGTIVRLCFPPSRTFRGPAAIPKPVLSTATLCDVG